MNEIDEHLKNLNRAKICYINFKTESLIYRNFDIVTVKVVNKDECTNIAKLYLYNAKKDLMKNRSYYFCKENKDCIDEFIELIKNDFTEDTILERM